MAQDDKLPDLDQDYVADVFDRLSNMDVELDPDPLELGPKRLREKIAETRGMRSQCEAIFLHLSQLYYNYGRSLRLTSVQLDVKKKRLLAEDRDVQAGPAAKDREAIAEMKLLTIVREESRLKGIVSELEALLIVVKAKRSDLIDIRSQLKSQERLCLEEIASLDGAWGSKLPPKKKAPSLDTGPAVKDPDDLDDFLANVAGELHLGTLEDDEEEVEDAEEEEEVEEELEEGSEAEEDQVPEESAGDDPEEVLPGTADEDEIDDFIDSIPATKKPDKDRIPPEEEEIDIDELLSGFGKG